MFCVDLVSLLWQWKHSGNEIILLEDFNENVYTRDIATALSQDGLQMYKLCQQITGIPLPHMHNRGAIPINCVYSTAGIDGVAVALLPSWISVGDHRVFIVVVTSSSMMGDVFLRVLPAAGCLLNCASDRIKYSYIHVLNQLTIHHRKFKKLYMIDHDCNYVSVALVQLQMNKVDLELEQFMKSSKKDCHKCKRNDIEGSPYSGVWLNRQWLLCHIQTYLSGNTRDPRNLFRECRKRGLSDPWAMTQDELNVEFFVCKENLNHLAKQDPYYCPQFLKRRVASAKAADNPCRAAKITGILHKEASRKRWLRVNRLAQKSCGGLTVAVKVPTLDGGLEEFKTKEGVFQVVSPILQELFQAALVAKCFRSTFFDDIGHLADGPVARQILEGTYIYPVYLDPATQHLFKEAAVTFSTLSPKQIATYVTVKDFQYFWQTAKERTGSSFSGLHFGHYIAASFCPDLSSLHAAKLSIRARNGVALSWWGRGLTVLLEKILSNVFVHKLQAICLLEADFNWWNKLIFAKWMMRQVVAGGSIPQECFAKTNSHCNNAVLT
jgi:hypothetical protein